MAQLLNMRGLTLVACLTVLALAELRTIEQTNEGKHIPEFRVFQLRNETDTRHSKPVLHVANIQLTELVIPLKRNKLSAQAGHILTQLLSGFHHTENAENTTSEEDATVGNATIEDVTIERPIITEEATIEHTTIEDATIKKAVVEDHHD